jgi:hypothetical protein
MATSMMPPASAGDLVAGVDLLRVAVAAYLARFKGTSRTHTESDLRCFLTWCADRELEPLGARRAHRAIRALDAGSPPLPALNGVPPVVGGLRVLPHLCAGYRADGVAGRARATATRAH